MFLTTVDIRACLILDGRGRLDVTLTELSYIVQHKMVRDGSQVVKLCFGVNYRRVPTCVTQYTGTIQVFRAFVLSVRVVPRNDYTN